MNISGTNNIFAVYIMSFKQWFFDTLHNALLCIVDENGIATIKLRNNFYYPFKMIIFPMLR